MDSNASLDQQLYDAAIVVVDSIEASMREYGGIDKPNLHSIVKAAFVHVRRLPSPAAGLQSPTTTVAGVKQCTINDVDEHRDMVAPLPGQGAGAPPFLDRPVSRAAYGQHVHHQPPTERCDAMAAVRRSEIAELRAQKAEAEAAITAAKADQETGKGNLEALAQALSMLTVAQAQVAAATAVLRPRWRLTEKLQRRETALEAAGKAYIAQMQKLGLDGGAEKLQALREKPVDPAQLPGELLPEYARLHMEVLEMQVSLREGSKEADKAMAAAVEANKIVDEVQARVGELTEELMRKKEKLVEGQVALRRAGDTTTMGAKEGSLCEATSAHEAALGSH